MSLTNSPYPSNRIVILLSISVIIHLAKVLNKYKFQCGTLCSFPPCELDKESMPAAQPGNAVMILCFWPSNKYMKLTLFPNPWPEKLNFQSRVLYILLVSCISGLSRFDEMALSVSSVGGTGIPIKPCMKNRFGFPSLLETAAREWNRSLQSQNVRKSADEEKISREDFVQFDRKSYCISSGYSIIIEQTK